MTRKILIPILVDPDEGGSDSGGGAGVESVVRGRR